MEPGLSIGIRVASKCTAVITQEALSSFHKAGKIALMDNESYLKYLKLTTKPSEVFTYVFIKEKLRAGCSEELGELKLKELIGGVEVRKSQYYESYKKYVRPDLEIPQSQALCIKFDKYKMYKRKLTPAAVADLIQSECPKVFAIPSPLVKMEIELIPKTSIAIVDLYSNIVRNDVLSNSVLYNLKVAGISGFSEGHPGVHKMSTTKGIDSLMGQPCTVYFGKGFSEVLQCSFVDTLKCYSNSISELQEYFGIITTKHRIINYMATMLNDKISESYLSILVNAMTLEGKVVPITHFENGRTFAFKLSSGNQLKHLTNSIEESFQTIPGDFDRILIGQRIRSGTGF